MGGKISSLALQKRIIILKLDRLRVEINTKNEIA